MPKSDEPEPHVSVLGTVSAESARYGFRRTGWLRRSRMVEEPPTLFEDWTIDGVPLRERMRFPDGTPCTDITLMTGHSGDRATIESLRALLGEDTSGFDPWVEFDDGRAAILFCPVCADLGCGAVSAEVVLGGTTAEWRTIAYQDGADGRIGTEEVPAFTLVFDRTQYEAVVRRQLEKWSEPGAPAT